MAGNGADGKKDARVFAVSQYSRISYAASVMNEHKVGCLVVTGDGGEAVGILSERDILKWVATATPQAYMQKVLDIMTSEFVSGQPGISNAQALDLMRQHKVRHLPILEDGYAVGMISIRDVLGDRDPEPALQTN